MSSAEFQNVIRKKFIRTRFLCIFHYHYYTTLDKTNNGPVDLGEPGHNAEWTVKVAGRRKVWTRSMEATITKSAQMMGLQKHKKIITTII